MMDDLLVLVAVASMAAAALGAYLSLLGFSTPAPCAAARTVLQSPGSELIVYGRFRVVEVGDYLYLDCGLYVEKSRAQILKTSGRLAVGSTADGRLYIR